MLVSAKELVILLIISVTTICLLSCSNIVEQEMIYDAGLHIISAETLEITESIPSIPGASCLLVRPGKLFVASSNGIVQCYNSADLTLIGEYIVGVASPAGYSEMVYSPSENTAYLIGAMGKILEISLPDCEVLDEFSVCQSPVDLAITSGTPGDLWVVDGPSNSVGRVNIQTNEKMTTTSIVSISIINELVASTYYPDSLLIGTTNLVYQLSKEEDYTRLTYVKGSFGADWSGLCPIPYDSNFIAINGGHIIGEFCAYDKTAFPPPSFYNTASIEDSDWITAAGNDYINVYALGSLGDGISRLYRYTYIAPSYGVNAYADFNGYPIDLKISDSGLIYVLTVEQ